MSSLGFVDEQTFIKRALCMNQIFIGIDILEIDYM